MSRLKGIKFPLIVILGEIFIWVFSTLPGNFSGDGIAVWYQVTGVAGFYDWHPVIYTLLIKLLTLNGLLPWIVTIFQCILMCISIYLLTEFLFPKNSQKKNLWTVAFLFATPFCGGIATEFWKDVPHTCFIIIGLTTLLNKKYKKIRSASIVITSIGLSFRHEGWIVFFVFFIVWTSLNLKNRFRLNFRTLFKSFVLIQIFSIVFSFGPPVMVNAVPSPAFLKSLSQIRDLGYVLKNNSSVFTQEEIALIKAPSNEIGFAYLNYCQDAAIYMTPTNFDYQIANANSGKISQIWLKKVLSTNFPMMYEARKCFAQAFLPPPLSFVSGVPDTSKWLFWGIEPNPLGLSTYNSDGLANKFIKKYVENFSFNGSWIAWPGLHFLLFCLATTILRFRRQPSSEINMFLSFLFIKYATFYVITVSMDFRYALMFHMFNLIFYLNFFSNHFSRFLRRSSRLG
jgi:hypothetical protein